MKNKKKSNNQIVQGKISVHTRGFGFVVVADREEDVFIPKPFINGAVHDDIVEIEIEEKVSSKGPEGKVLQVLERARSTLYCVLIEKVKPTTYIAFAPMLGTSKEIIVSSCSSKAEKGDRIVAKVTDWGSKENAITATFTDYIGNIEDPTSDLPASIAEFHLHRGFSKEAIKEARKYKEPSPKNLEKDRRDCTAMTSFTIDPTTAKDFDDALSVDRDNDGNYHLAIHIADVSHYVKPSTVLDEEAYTRGNSTYLPTTCLPMIPEELSNELCSLKENVPRLTLSVFTRLSPKGELLQYKISKSIIQSQKRFTYEEAMEVLEGKKTHPLLPKLKLLTEVASILKQKRRARGSVDLSSKEVSLDYDSKGQPTGFHVIDYDITHQMVEECMLLANEIVATHLKERKGGSLYRVHEEPNKEQSLDFRSLALLLGYPLKESPSAVDIQALFEKAKGSALGHQLSTAYIRSMKLAIYSNDNIGHFGLCLENYTHFTSPIRRYSDLVIHRLLFEKDYYPNLKEIALHCSETERASFKAEMAGTRLKTLRFLKYLFDKEKEAIYPALLTKINSKGVVFELENLLTDGFIHIRHLGFDYYEYDEVASQLVGADTEERFFLGMKIQVQIKSVDLSLLDIEWTICKKKPANSSPKKSRKRK